MLCKWTVDRIGEVLADPGEGGWMRRWLEVLKEESEMGFAPPVAQYGYGDPTSISISAAAVHRFNMTGAIRHGAESFNYYFPQEMDPQYKLVTCPLHARYMNVT